MSCPHNADVVAGSTGFLGSHLLNQLRSMGHCVIEIKRESWKLHCVSSPRPAGNKSSNTRVLIEAFESHGQLSCVYNAATRFSKAQLPEDLFESTSSNVSYPLALAQSAVLYSAERFVQFNSEWQLNPELMPDSTYVKTKCLAEDLLSSLFSLCEVSYHSIYLGDTFGANDTRGKLVQRLIEAKLNDERVQLLDPGRFLNLLHVQDLANFLTDSDQWKSLKKMHLVAPDLIQVAKIYEILSGTDSDDADVETPVLTGKNTFCNSSVDQVVVKRAESLEVQLLRTLETYDL